MPNDDITTDPPYSPAITDRLLFFVLWVLFVIGRHPGIIHHTTRRTTTATPTCVTRRDSRYVCHARVCDDRPRPAPGSARMSAISFAVPRTHCASCNTGSLSCSNTARSFG